MRRVFLGYDDANNFRSYCIGSLAANERGLHRSLIAVMKMGRWTLQDSLTSRSQLLFALVRQLHALQGADKYLVVVASIHRRLMLLNFCSVTEEETRAKNSYSYQIEGLPRDII